MAARERRSRQTDLHQTLVRFDPGVVKVKAVDSLKRMVASRHFEGGASVVKLSHALDLDALDVPFFSCFLAMGLVPPISRFCLAVLSSYGLLISQLHPHAVLIMAAFQHLCEGFVGVTPSVALFRHIYHLRVDAPPVPAGGVTWCLRSNFSREYVNGELLSMWEEWRGAWSYVRV